MNAQKLGGKMKQEPEIHSCYKLVVYEGKLKSTFFFKDPAEAGWAYAFRIGSPFISKMILWGKCGKPVMERGTYCFTRAAGLFLKIAEEFGVGDFFSTFW
jgi:hypothetical protein